MSAPQPRRIFGYGSLIWKVDFPISKAQPGWIEGYVRRFWQASWDHRGTVESPGRVATLVAKDSPALEGCRDAKSTSRVFGTVYELDPASQEETIEHLAFREKAGYSLQDVTVYKESTGEAVLCEAPLFSLLSVEPAPSWSCANPIYKYI